MELERPCQGLMQEVQLLSERQEVLVGMVVSKRDMQRAKKGLELLQKKHTIPPETNSNDFGGFGN